MIQHKFYTMPKNLSLQDLKPLSGFSFLMDKEIENAYRLWMSIAVENFGADNVVAVEEEAEAEEEATNGRAVALREANACGR